MSDVGEMIRVLCRWRDDDTGEELYYAGGWQTGAVNLSEGAVVGVCRTPKGQRPDRGESIEEFRANVDEVATAVRWFDDPMEVSDA